jgi:IS30 family transposase
LQVVTANGLLRQSLPTGTDLPDLSVFSQAKLDAIATRLNSRPRKTGATPANSRA